MVLDFFAAADASLATLLPTSYRLIAWAVVSGVAATMVYRKFSDQQQLARIAHDVERVRTALNAHDGGFKDAWLLTRHRVKLALRRMLLTLFPTLFALVPTAIVLLGGQSRFFAVPGFGIGFDWTDRWEATFLAMNASAALLTKIAYGIR